MVDCGNLGDHMLRSWANESTVPTALEMDPENNLLSLCREASGVVWIHPKEKDKQGLRREG